MDGDISVNYFETLQSVIVWGLITSAMVSLWWKAIRPPSR